MLPVSTFLKTVIINISDRSMTFIGDDNTKKVMEFESIDSFIARREFIEQNTVGFTIEYACSVQ